MAPVGIVAPKLSIFGVPC